MRFRRDEPAEGLPGIAGRVRDDAAAWCEGRSWLWRAPLLLYLAWGGVRHLRDPYYGTLLFGGITFGIHELGHVLFGCTGHFLGALGGSLAQVLAPVGAGAVFARQRDYFGICVAGSWLAFSLWNLATYIGDAREQELPLLGLSEDPEHDWGYLLGVLGLLPADHAIAFLTRLLAFAAWGASLLFGAWLLFRMARGGTRISSLPPLPPG